MIDFLVKHKLINPSQHGFLKARSFNSTIDWSQAQYEKGGGLLSGRASERKSEPK